MEHWERFCPGGLRFVYEDTLFRPGTDSFLLGSFPRLRPGESLLGGPRMFEAPRC